MKIPRPHGFTLIELVTAMAVIGILTMIAIPSYHNAMQKGRRTSAEAHLLDIAQRQRQYLADARSYAADLATLSISTPDDVAAYYDITCCSPGATPPTFTVSATPKSSQADDACGILSVDQSGRKGTSSGLATCW